MKVNIGFIYGFYMQKEMVRKVVTELSDQVEVFFEIGILENAIPSAKRLEKGGTEVILSSGLTSRIIEKEISVPVVDIRIQDFDIMKAVKQGHKFGKKIALLVPWRVNGLDLLEKLYDVRIRQIFYEDQNDVNHGVVEAFNEGCEVLIAKGYRSLELAQEYGKKGVLLTFNEESVRQAFSDAMKLARLRRKEREEYTRLKTIFNSLTEGVIVSDSLGRITLFNRAAERIFGVNADEALDRPIGTIFPDNRVAEILKKGIQSDGDLFSVGDTNIIASHVPIVLEEGIIGVVLTFREASEIQKIDSKIRKRIMARGFIANYTIDHFTAGSLAMKKVVEKTKRFAATDSTILIKGETGTGKEILAQSIHRLSLRSRKPFIGINCSVFPESLLESELFGYDEGAFTGAKRGGKMGLFELAHGGTLFLDEISTMPINLQSKLLRVLQQREVMRLGGDRVIPIDVRIIASTNRDLVNTVKKDLFREDLYFRLNVLTIRMPTLRERREDIRDLFLEFVSHYCNKYGKNEIPITNKVLGILKNYSWPGNVRELENVSERFVLLHDGFASDSSLIDELLTQELCGYHSFDINDNCRANFVEANNEEPYFYKTLRQEQRDRIIRYLRRTNFNKSRAASLLGMSRSTLYRKVKDLQIGVS